MKKTKKYNLIFTSVFVIGLFSCQDELDLEPISELTTGNYYQTETHMDAAVTGMYNALRPLFAEEKPYMAQSASDNTSQLFLNYNEGERGISQYKVTTDNFVVLDYWQRAFQAIYRCNVVLDKIVNIEYEEPSKKERHVAEAKFIRAIIYFDLVRFFGGVPLLTELIEVEDSYQKGRATKDEVYSQIKKDLIEASSALPAIDNSGRATRFSALAMLADVHLNLEEYSETKLAIDQVINSGNYGLHDDWAEVYKDANNNSKHSIFAVQFLNQADEGNPYPSITMTMFIDTSLWPFAGTNNPLVPSEDLWLAYSENDVRRDLSIIDSYVDGRDGTLYEDSYLQVKHGINNKPSAFQVWGINHIVMRYAEALLISAEAENKLGNSTKAVQIINQIRNRAGLSDFTSSDQTEIHEEVYLQRRLELAFENERWFDIQRSGKAKQIIDKFVAGTSYTYSDTYALFPIPQVEIGKVGSDILTQNPGY